MDEWLKKDLDDLYIQAGRGIERKYNEYGRFKIQEGYRDVKKALQPTDYYIKRVNDFIEQKKAKLKEIICPHYNRNQQNLDDASIVVGSLSAALLIESAHAWPLLAIIIKRGLNRLCS